ncbi:MAG: UDP-N-acetylmuramate--L-alanine ligase [Chitinispirillales bacterium]|jgi:UDP-N-acetylmuramate--alanine ligase|nr:UDP-N-acetylmuramate--L-alanine ligase [Chitinispirillales bacterium]
MINAKKIHFLGIAGSGCSNMAMWLKMRGFDVSGSDISQSDTIQNLQKMGIPVQIGHDPQENMIGNSDLVVFSSAIKENNQELIFAKNTQKTVIKRAKMLAMMTEEAENSIAVSGCAGKTSTTGFLSSVFCAAKKDPSVILGGVFAGKENGMRVGNDKYFLVEADEYDRSFLEMKNIKLAICTGLEAEHLDTYGSFNGVKDGFVKFFTDSMRKDDAIALVYTGSQGVRDIYSRIKCRKISYGFDFDNDYRAIDDEYKNGVLSFCVMKNRKNLGKISLKLIGKHNALNALAAIAAGMETGIPFEEAVKGVENFDGIKKRMEKITEIGGIKIYSDYAHHPSKISATLSAFRQTNPKRIITIFQPHTYTRVRDFAQDFANSLEKDSDFIFLTKIYGARENEIDGISEKSIAKYFEKENYKIVAKQDIAKEYRKIAKSGDIVIFMSAGDLDLEIENFIKEFDNG